MSDLENNVRSGWMWCDEIKGGREHDQIKDNVPIVFLKKIMNLNYGDKKNWGRGNSLCYWLAAFADDWQRNQGLGSLVLAISSFCLSYSF